MISAVHRIRADADMGEAALKLQWPSSVEQRAVKSDEVLLLDRVAKGDVHAFEGLYRLYQPRLTRFLSTLLKRRELVEEVLDDTMMAVWHSAGKFRGSSKVSTWVFAIAWCRANHARSRWPDPVEHPELGLEVCEDPLPDEELQHWRLRTALLKAMDRLSTDHRAVVDLTYFHGLAYREIAAIVDCPVDTVKTRMFYARRHLRHALQGCYSDWL
jgi:RNA polymerase sigma-70 factor (ECF subfamily)